MIDLNVLVRSFNCESRACYVGKTRESFFFEFAKVTFFRDSFAKVGYYNHYMKTAATHCRPGSGRRRQLGISVWFWFSSLCGGAAELPKARLRDSQAPWSWSTSLHLPLSLPNDAFWSLKKQAPNAVAKFPKVRLCESQTPRPLVFAFPSMQPLLMALVCE